GCAGRAPEGARRLHDLAALGLLEVLAHLRRSEAAVSPEGTDRRDLAGARPAGDRLGVDAEERGNLGRGEKCVGSLVFSHGSPFVSDWCIEHTTGPDCQSIAQSDQISIVTND